MPAATCPACSARLTLPDDAAGQSWRCPECDATFHVKSKHRRSRTWLLVILLLVVLPVAGGLATWLALKDRPGEGTQPGRLREPPNDWTHAELREHLKGNGLECLWARPLDSTSLALVMVRPDAREELAFVAGFTAREVEMDPVIARIIPAGCALVVLKPLASMARERAAVIGNYALAWGRFLFIGDPEFLRDIEGKL